MMMMMMVVIMIHMDHVTARMNIMKILNNLNAKFLSCKKNGLEKRSDTIDPGCVCASSSEKCFNFILFCPTKIRY